jgi:hypothetical protein
MADWFAIYREADGTLVSLATVVADPLPAGLAKKQVTQFTGGVQWDTATLDWEPKPPLPPDVDRIDEFVAALPIVLKGQDEERIRTSLVALLGDQRFRDPSDSYELRSP